MRSLSVVAASALLAASSALLAQSASAPASVRIDAGNLPRFTINAVLDPATHELSAEVTVDLPAASAGTAVEFLLAAPLNIESSMPTLRELPVKGSGFSGINGSSTALLTAGRARRWQAQLAPGERRVSLRYRGRMELGFDTPEQEYARGFSETVGSLSDKGVYLAGSSLWYPWLGDTLFTFDIKARTPDGWMLVSPGAGSARDANGEAHWTSTDPIDELHLVGGPLRRYTRAAGNVEAQVYLRTPDEALAAKYLEATARYLEMYRTLIGAYPYGKFALVENFWETGYGMPSFTLLGPQIIRFPFILTSSYPHEILHNWWGNSVFVDYASGNWCEGLTAYLADHLLKEQSGQGAEYRRDTLKKYRDFVGESQDFPLTAFRSRHSPSTEAVGYGKALMLFHMTRQQVGDDAYRRGLQRFYRERRGTRATFTDLRVAQEAASKQSLVEMYDQWVQRAGAPDLRVLNASVARDGAGWLVSGRLRQQQKAAAFHLSVPLRIQTATALSDHRIAMTTRETNFSVRVDAEPLSLEIDPEFDLFRLLDSRETAPSLGQIFGDKALVAVMPSRATTEQLAAYQGMLDAWKSPTTKVTVTTDKALRKLPADAAVWVFGRDNDWAPRVFGDDASIGFSRDAASAVFAGERVPFAGNSIVVVRRNPSNPVRAAGWIAVDPLSAAPGLARKLPHYGKYSWLGFTGEEPANKWKGEWVASDSPLRVDLRPAAMRTAPLPAVKPPPRAALANLPAVFDERAMLGDVQWLAAPEREGRGVGSAGLAAASDWLAARMKAAGLAPGGANNSWIQEFPVEPVAAAPGSTASAPVSPGATARNVIGVLRGANPAFDGQWVLVSAHYDHLGRNGVGVRVSELGQVHPGADDNASGTAVMLELARVLAGAGAPQRTLVFVGFSAEEHKLQGSGWFVERPLPLPLGGLRAVVNLDTVGQLRGNPLSVLATGTAREWGPIVQGVGFTTGVSLRSIPGNGESSDQQSFIARGIPGIQLFSGANLDYHRPTDTADKVDSAGLVKVAMVAREIVSYLAERPTPLTATIAAGGTVPGATAGAQPGEGGSRRVSYGLVPDFAYTGAGVRAESVTPESPAAKAGMQAGDVLLAMNGRTVANLAEFSNMMKAFKAGDKVPSRVQRGTNELQLEVILVER